MKSAKMMSAIAAATLSLGTAACQMPVEDEDAILEQDAETLEASEEEGGTCRATFRALMDQAQNQLRLEYADGCMGDQHTLYLTSSESLQDLHREAQLGVYGEFVGETAGGYYVVGSSQFRGETDDAPGELKLEVFSNEELAATISMVAVLQEENAEGASYEVEGETVWSERSWAGHQ